MANFFMANFAFLLTIFAISPLAPSPGLWLVHSAHPVDPSLVSGWRWGWTVIWAGAGYGNWIMTGRWADAGIGTGLDLQLGLGLGLDCCQS